MSPTVEWTNGRQNRKEEFLGNIEGVIETLENRLIELVEKNEDD